MGTGVGMSGGGVVPASPAINLVDHRVLRVLLAAPHSIVVMEWPSCISSLLAVKRLTSNQCRWADP